MLAVLLLLFSISFGIEYIIKLKPGADESFLRNYKVIKKFKNYVLVESPELEGSHLKSLSVNPEIEYVAKNIKLRAFAVPNDPLYPEQWGLKIINAEGAWDKNTDCSQVVVAIVDTGIDYFHKDLRGNIWINTKEANGYIGVDDDNNGYTDDCYGWDFVQRDNQPLDDNGHGTIAAGIVGAVGNNSEGVAGVCWRVRMMSLKILDSSGQGDAFSFLRAVQYAVDNGAKVINTSLGTCPVGYTDSNGNVCKLTSADLQPLKDAVEYALNHGVMIVAAAGNDGLDTDRYPVYPASYSKDYPNVISVASVNSDGNLSSFSNFGVKTVDIGAPGGTKDGMEILSTVPSDYGYAQGTSIATPFVAGAVAHILSSNSLQNLQDIKNRLLFSVTTTSSLLGKVRSGGYLNLNSALQGLTFSPSKSFSSVTVHLECGKPLPSKNSGGCSVNGSFWIPAILILIFLLRRLIFPKLS